MDGWNTIRLPFGGPGRIFRWQAVSFREGNIIPLSCPSLPNTLWIGAKCQPKHLLRPRPLEAPFPLSQPSQVANCCLLWCRTLHFPQGRWWIDSPRISGTPILGISFPLDRPYPYSLNRFSDSSILGTERNVTVIDTGRIGCPTPNHDCLHLCKTAPTQIRQLESVSLTVTTCKEGEPVSLVDHFNESFDCESILLYLGSYLSIKKTFWMDWRRVAFTILPITYTAILRIGFFGCQSHPQSRIRSMEIIPSLEWTWILRDDLSRIQ